MFSKEKSSSESDITKLDSDGEKSEGEPAIILGYRMIEGKKEKCILLGTLGKPDVSSDEEISKSGKISQTSILQLNEELPDEKHVRFNDYVKVFGSFSEDSKEPRGKKLKSPGPRAGTPRIVPSPR